MERFYDKNETEQLDEKLFQNPTAEYRGAPFWAWNGALDREELLRQTEVMKEMGMGGFHIHVRTGLDTPYLGQEYMEHVKACMRKAEQERMLVWLYDEDRWPSGSAGGMVTRTHPEYAAKSLLITVRPYETEPAAPGTEALSDKISAPGRGRGGVRQENGELLAVYDVLLGEDGTLADYKRILPEQEAAGVKWYAFLEHACADPWFNDAPYSDTLDREAVQRFLETTHSAYEKAVGEEFGRRIPAIFTDEPQFNAKTTLSFAEEQKDVFLPWSESLAPDYLKRYGDDILEKLPELLWELPEGKISLTRYRYHDFVAERFAENYCGLLGSWCREHNIRLTGHLMGEGSLEEQTRTLGECMRCYKFFDIPGTDCLCDRREYTAAKQVQSAARQQGAEGVLSELYGAAGWDYDFRGYRQQGDWQAALGVTVRVPHLFWMTMKGEAKRDFPPCIGYQSPWYRQFALIENYFARLNTALTRGKPVVRIAVLHPIESYWLHWGPEEQTGAVREQMEERFQKLTEYLLFSLLDFDFISENELPLQCREGGAPLQVGCMAYEAVVVCGCETLRRTTLERLEAFWRAGGELFFAGSCPGYIDALPSDKAAALYHKAGKLELTPASLQNALKRYAFVEIYREDGRREDSLLSQLRRDGRGLWLFLAGGRRAEGRDTDEGRRLRIVLKGLWRVKHYNAMTGEITEIKVCRAGGRTIWQQEWYLHDSMLLWLTAGTEGERQKLPGMGEGGTIAAGIQKMPQDCKEGEQEPSLETVRTALPEGDIRAVRGQQFLTGPVEYFLWEPNMCLLDIAEFAVDDGEWQPREEILRIDNIARAQCGLPLRRREVVQSYLLEKEVPRHKIRLRFRVESLVELQEVRLGLEDAQEVRIEWNGRRIPPDTEGFYVDKSIGVVKLGRLEKGQNLLELTVPLGRRTNLEAAYLLGNFGVELAGTQKIIKALPERIGFGDITAQGLPFYTGNLDYFFEIKTGRTADTGKEDGAVRPAELCVPMYRGAVIQVFLDDEEKGYIAFSPYCVELTVPEKLPGKENGADRHRVTLRLYGTRQNGFGQLHHTPGVWFYQGPNSWRSTGRLWRYEYHLKEAGILSSPILQGAEFAET